MISNKSKTLQEAFTEAFSPAIEAMMNLWDEVKKIMGSLNEYLEEINYCESRPKLRPVKKINPNKTILLNKRIGVYRCRNCC